MTWKLLENAFSAASLFTPNPILVPPPRQLYRTSDYREELIRSTRWLEERLHPRSRLRPSSRKRSPSAPQCTTDHRTRRIPSDSAGASKPLSYSPNNVSKSPDREDQLLTGIFGDRTNDSGLLDRTELEAMLRVLNEAIRFMDMVESSSLVSFASFQDYLIGFWDLTHEVICTIPYPNRYCWNNWRIDITAPMLCEELKFLIAWTCALISYLSVNGIAHEICQNTNTKIGKSNWKQCGASYTRIEMPSSKKFLHRVGFVCKWTCFRRLGNT